MIAEPAVGRPNHDKALHLFKTIDQGQPFFDAHHHDARGQTVGQGTGFGQDGYADDAVGNGITGAGVEYVAVKLSV